MTAVEWLIEEVECRGLVTKELRLAFFQAKEMHKQEIINTWYNGYINQSPMIDEENCGEQFYKETFKQD